MRVNGRGWGFGILGWCSILVMGMTLRAEAQVGSYYIDKTAYYFQNSDNVAGSLGYVNVAPGVYTNNAGDITSASVTLPGASAAVDLVQHGTSWGLAAFDDTFSSLADADSAYPNGNYLFQTAGGTVGTTAMTVQLSGAYPAEPVFTGTSLTDLATMDPRGPITITFNGFTPDPSLNYGHLAINFSGPGGQQDFDLPITATSFTFPANTFEPASTYYINLLYYNDNTSTPGYADYSSYTDSMITTASVPEPTGVVFVVLSVGALAGERRRRARG